LTTLIVAVNDGDKVEIFRGKGGKSGSPATEFESVG